VNNLLRNWGWRIYHTVHTMGWPPMWFIGAPYYVENFWRGFKYKKFSKHHITPEELWEYRQLEPSSTLVTGVTNICNAKCTFCAYPKVVGQQNPPDRHHAVRRFKKAVDEWAAVGGQSLDLTPVVGDPLVDPGLLEKIDYAVNTPISKTWF